MCGIAGVLRWDGRSPELAEVGAMTGAMAHRGPDGDGFHVRGPVALGHRRLAIIDLATGRQPMSNEDGEVWVTFNGEIYNYVELRADLEARGHRFATRSDTETLAHGWEEWGTDLVRRLRGMFAFAIADHRARRLFLARDGVGIKPLYWREGPGVFAFASEINALRKADLPVPEGDVGSVELFLRHQYVPGTRTVFRDVHELEPACWMEVGFDGKRSAPTRYWDLRFEPLERAAAPPGGWDDAVAETLRSSVRAHLVSDVPFGVLLSGGVDSTLVAAEMRQILDRPVNAFTIGFDPPDRSELPHAHEAAKRLGLEWTHEVVPGASLDGLPDLVARFGEPFGDASALPTWHVARLARTQVPMVLSGDGGDEAFGGYASYDRWMGLLSRGHLARLALRSARRAWRLWREQRARARAGGGPDLAEWERTVLWIDAESRRALWRPEFHRVVDEPAEAFAAAARRASTPDRLGFAQTLDLHTYLSGAILPKVDVASMAHGLEVRPPLLDREVLELAAKLPLSERMTVDGRGRIVGKAVLKRLLARTFPEEFVHRKKSGFAPPLRAWFAEGGAARALLRDVTASPNARLFDLVRPEAVEALLRQHGAEGDRSNALWLLLVLGLWLERNREVRFS